jgi:hypothetical protein
MTTLRNRARAVFAAAFGVEPASEIAGFAATVTRLGDLTVLYVRTTGATRISDVASVVALHTPINALTEWARLHDTDPDYVLGIYFAEMEKGE